MQPLQTGDIFLFEFEKTPGLMGFIECCIRCFTDSRYSHAAFVWVDPIIPENDFWNQHYNKTHAVNGKMEYEEYENGYVKLIGPYIWDSALHEIKGVDGKKHFGVQLTPLKKYLDKWSNTKNGSKMTIYRRSPLTKNTAMEFLKKDKEDDRHNKISRMTWLYLTYNRTPYDINCCDWFRACLRCRCVPRHQNDALFCSAFVSMILTKCGILPRDTHWKVISPGELSSHSSWCVHWLQWNPKKQYSVDTVWNYSKKTPLNFNLKYKD